MTLLTLFIIYFARDSLTALSTILAIAGLLVFSSPQKNLENTLINSIFPVSFDTTPDGFYFSPVGKPIPEIHLSGEPIPKFLVFRI